MRGALSRALTALLLLALAAQPMVAVDDEEEVGLPILESGIAAVDLTTQRLSIRYSTTISGPLVEVRPLIERLGGTLEVGPLGEAHELTINNQTYEFGPGSDALTSGSDIIDLSQATRGGRDDQDVVQVPLDLLDHIYGQLLGYEFTWNPTARILAVRHQPARELDMQFNLVHVQGVTTVVFQFPTRPRYRIHDSPRSVTITLVGDRLTDSSMRPIPPDDLVHGITLARNGMRLQLAPGTVAEDYVLDNPFRLVFDVFRGGSRAASDPEARPSQDSRRQRQTGIRTIILDPGHGGSDSGAVGGSGLQEKNLVLQLARTVRRLLEERLPVRVVLTRTADGELPLQSRAARANQNKGDLFVSLHMNSATGQGVQGAETYYLSIDSEEDVEARSSVSRSVGGVGGDPLFDLQLQLWDLAQLGHVEQSRTLAGLIQEELNAALESPSRGARQAPLRVLKGVAMPAVLVEFGFLSNPNDEAQLQSAEHQYRLADALVKGIMRYRAQVTGVPLPSETDAAEPTP